MTKEIKTKCGEINKLNNQIAALISKNRVEKNEASPSGERPQKPVKGRPGEAWINNKVTKQSIWDMIRGKNSSNTQEVQETQTETQESTVTE